MLRYIETAEQFIRSDRGEPIAFVMVARREDGQEFSHFEPVAGDLEQARQRTQAVMQNNLFESAR